MGLVWSQFHGLGPIPYLNNFLENLFWCLLFGADCSPYLTRRVICGHFQGLFREEKGGVTIFFTPYEFWIFNSDDEIRIRFRVPIRRYRIVMRISYLLIFTSTELEFLKIIVKWLIKLSNARLVPIASVICYLIQFSIICRPITTLCHFMLLEFSIQP